MYPFDYESSIVHNRWYIAAFSNEISREPMERTLLNKPVAMYRKEDGTPVAMYGLCPHRYYPLAKGRLEGNSIVCGYHGFTFTDTGECVDVPSQDSSSSKICQPVYPLEERGPICWIWMGDLDKCDKDLIPPYEEIGLNQPGWHYSSENYFHIAGRAQLLIDNLMDLTHLPYVHHHVPGGESMKKTAMTIEDRELSLRVIRRGKVPWSPFFDLTFGKEFAYQDFADFEGLSDFYGPELIRTSLPIITRVVGLEGVPDGFGSLYILHGVTPETDKTTHYFGFATRNYRLGDAVLDNFWLESDNKIRQQDADAIELVEKRLDSAVSFQKEQSVRSDRAAFEVRRRIDAMLAKEQGEIAR